MEWVRWMGGGFHTGISASGTCTWHSHTYSNCAYRNTAEGKQHDAVGWEECQTDQKCVMTGPGRHTGGGGYHRVVHPCCAFPTPSPSAVPIHPLTTLYRCRLPPQRTSRGDSRYHSAAKSPRGSTCQAAGRTARCSPTRRLLRQCHTAQRDSGCRSPLVHPLSTRLRHTVGPPQWTRWTRGSSGRAGRCKAQSNLGWSGP
jgi:hypothetical protein